MEIFRELVVGVALPIELAPLHGHFAGHRHQREQPLDLHAAASASAHESGVPEGSGRVSEGHAISLPRAGAAAHGDGIGILRNGASPCAASACDSRSPGNTP